MLKKYVILKEDIKEDGEVAFKANEKYEVHSNGRDVFNREFILSKEKKHCAVSVFSISDCEEIWE